jgi:hypothetical protein
MMFSNLSIGSMAGAAPSGMLPGGDVDPTLVGVADAVKMSRDRSVTEDGSVRVEGSTYLIPNYVQQVYSINWEQRSVIKCRKIHMQQSYR